MDPLLTEAVDLLDKASRPHKVSHVKGYVFCPVCTHIVSPQSEAGKVPEYEVRVDCYPDCLGFRIRRFLEKVRGTTGATLEPSATRSP